MFSLSLFILVLSDVFPFIVTLQSNTKGVKMTEEDFWEEYDIIHNNRHKSVLEIERLLNEPKQRHIAKQNHKNIDTLILEANAISFMIERFN